MESTRARSTIAAETFLLSSACFLTAYASGFFISTISEFPIIWLADAVFLAYLLRTEGRYLPGNSLAVWSATCLAFLADGASPIDAVAFSAIHLFQTLLAYALVCNLHGAIVLLERLGQALGLFFYGALLPSAGGAIAAAGYLVVMHGHDFQQSWLDWWFTGALGLLVATPPLLTWDPDPRSRIPFSRQLAESFAWPAFSLVITALVFLQTSPVNLYLMLPPLLIMAIRLPSFIYSLTALINILLACYLTITGNGPFWQDDSSLPPHDVVQSLEFFLGVVFLTTYIVSAIVKELRDAQTKLQTSEKRLDEAHELLQLGNWEWNFITNQQHWDERLCRVFGLKDDYPATVEELEKVLHEDDRERVFDDIRKARVAGTSFEHQFRIVRPDGRIRYLHCVYTFVTEKSGRVVESHGTCRDITHEKRTEAQFREQAYRDTLTGLPNRAYLNNRLAQAVARGERHGFRFSVMMLDLDYFKQINDLHGHGVGDQVLVEVARRLTKSLRINDTVTRLGGDEFTIVVEETCQPEDLKRIAEKIIQSVSQPIQVDNVRCAVGVSIGCAIFPDHGQEENTLLERADKAMYQVKRRGRNGFELAS
ncbi:sensor domain-containing diguanylate cyclase [Aestuariispira insulae]|uniref:PAS domain S-box-containing protein/diguanylate cyclase (GGDEF)-like protein n=1 Tax=Aestuariispira insulae TaxID=1461337 RepID=A0A3D9HPT7_9PROT|nr:sensor domain-containing diguanylate cyclase [Aestuariispira insulae]RED50916.1 PAS domain S-box-containing protein/diguanylate cyclase (GGDEF)-like protein [Aestuariispira insulae]